MLIVLHGTNWTASYYNCSSYSKIQLSVLSFSTYSRSLRLNVSVVDVFVFFNIFTQNSLFQKMQDWEKQSVLK